MKIILLTLLISINLFGAKIDEFATKANYHRDYKTALSIAKNEKKMLMLLVVADYCPWCKKFEKKTLLHSSIKKIIKENFIPVVVDKLKEKDSFPKEFASPLIPAVFFIDPYSQKDIHKTIAYMTKKEYKENMDKAIQKFKSEHK